MKKLLALALAACLSSTAAFAEEAAAPEAPAKVKKDKKAKGAKKAAKKKDDRTPFEKELGRRLKKLKLEAEVKENAAQAISERHDREVELHAQVKATARSKDPLAVATALRDYHGHQVETLEALQSALGDDEWANMVGPKKKAKKAEAGKKGEKAGKGKGKGKGAKKEAEAPADG